MSRRVILYLIHIRCPISSQVISLILDAMVACCFPLRRKFTAFKVLGDYDGDAEESWQC